MGQTFKDAKEQATARLRITAHSQTAALDAERLLSHVTGLSRTALLTHPDHRLTLPQLEAFYQAVERRALSEPVQYITGVQEFYGLELEVTPAVLIPRPETEHLVEAALDLANSMPGQLRILDVGTGSGAIAIALAHHLPSATIVATDLSAAALAVANANATRHGLAARITFVACDLVPPEAGLFDMICSNPPYIAETEKLETQVAAYEPAIALFAGPSGLEVYKRLIPAACASLRPGGSLLLEIGHGQQPDMDALLRSIDLENVRFLPDLQHIPRVAIATRR